MNKIWYFGGKKKLRGKKFTKSREYRENQRPVNAGNFRD